MPNHITNVVTFEGSESDIQGLLTRIAGEKGPIDFEAIVPMPASVKATFGDAGFNPAWYSWSCDNWGTKWNAYDQDLTDGTLSFDTAWAHPQTIFEAISKLYLNVTLRVAYADEDIGHNCGTNTYRGGELVEHIAPVGKAATEFALDLKGYDKEEWYAEQAG